MVQKMKAPYIFIFVFYSLALFACGNSEVSSNPMGSIGTGSGKATLSWEAPTTNKDGTLLTDLAGFKIYYGKTSPLVKGTSTNIDAGNTTIFILNGLDDETYFFSVSGYDFSGNESTLSEEVSKIFG